MLTALVALFGGLVLLVVASDWLVDGAVGIARRLGVPTLVVGLTIVAYGTSLPEFVVSVISAWRGVGDFAIGNIIGSNVANIGLVLGATAIVAPFAVKGRLLFRRDLPLLAVASVGAVLAFVDDVVSRWEGILLLALAVVFTVASLRAPPEEAGPDEPHDDEPELSPSKAGGMLGIGLLGLMIGAHFMVEGGQEIARYFGISERVIGLTVVAVGTSLPELAASMAGAVKGYPELAVGNVVGSCLFNLAFVLGAASVLHPIPTNFDGMVYDLAVMGGLTLLMWLMLRTGRRLSRVEGTTLVLIYEGFLGWLAIDVAHAKALSAQQTPSGSGSTPP